MSADLLTIRLHRVVGELKSTYVIGNKCMKCVLIFFRTNLYFLSKRGMENDMQNQNPPEMLNLPHLIHSLSLW